MLETLPSCFGHGLSGFGWPLSRGGFTAAVLLGVRPAAVAGAPGRAGDVAGLNALGAAGAGANLGGPRSADLVVVIVTATIARTAGKAERGDKEG